MTFDLTPKQAEVLAFMRDFEAENDALPSDRSVCKHFGWRSANAAFEHFRALERHGAIERNAQGGWRFVRRHVEHTLATHRHHGGEPR